MPAARDTLCSHTFYAAGTLNGLDQKFTFPAWETVDIEIVQAELAIYQGAQQISYCSMCNNNPTALDVIGWWMPGGAGNSRVDYPAGTCTPFPHAGGYTVDFHLAGPNNGAPFQIFMTLRYIKGPFT
jgi:hypothetical protein